MIKVSIVGASGYTGGELLRLLLFHPEVEVIQVTSERFAGKPVTRIHPNLRSITTIKFSSLDALFPCDLLFLCLPHGQAAKQWEVFSDLTPRIIDLSADFRLNDADLYQKYYNQAHPSPERLTDVVYGIPELHREEIKSAKYVACAGCNATVSILGLYPLFHAGLVDPSGTVVDVKVGSSEAGNRSSEASHHPERSGSLRSFSPTGHRHTAEMVQELSFQGSVKVHFSGTAIDMVRGALATSHVFLKTIITDKDLWKIYRKYFGHEPFIRIVKERVGIFRYPEPKLLAGTNYCDIGFESDADSNRVVVISAIDNLMKGSAGQAVQVFNILYGIPECTALEFQGLHPI